MSAERTRGIALLADEARLGLRTIDAPFVAVTVASSALALIAFGILNAIIPTPFFVRPIAAEPFAIVIWLVSAPMMGFVLATYLSRPKPVPSTAPPVLLTGAAEPRDRSTLGWLGGLGSFLAIGCPVCNKIALLLLGTSGALDLYAPIQPLIGVAALGLLTATLVWRLRLRARDGCAIAPATNAYPAPTHR